MDYNTRNELFLDQLIPSRAATRRKEVGRLHERGYLGREKKFNVRHFAHKFLLQFLSNHYSYEYSKNQPIHEE